VEKTLDQIIGRMQKQWNVENGLNQAKDGAKKNIKKAAAAAKRKRTIAHLPKLYAPQWANRLCL
jgi:hypothetical protein